MGNEMLEDDEITVRPEIMAFAVEMERVMRSHDDEQGDSYKHMTTEDYGEAIIVIVQRLGQMSLAHRLEPSRVGKLAARIGCYAMFFHYGYRNHHSTKVQP
jgi:hypothetical protein